jgi:hypothetical protein
VSPTSEASERQRKAAFKAWETIRRKQAAKTKSESSEISGGAEAKKTAPEIRKAPRMKEVIISQIRIYPKDWKQIGAEIRERARKKSPIASRCGYRALRRRRSMNPVRSTVQE